MMSTLKNAALLGLAAGDRVMFAPVAAPTAPYGQVAYSTAPEAASAYALSAEAFAQPVEYIQPVSENAAPQFWLWTGAGALAVLGAAAAAGRKPSAVADLEEADLESARIATLGVGGERQKKENPWSLTNFLMSGRKDRFGKTNNELEILSGVTKPNSDDPRELNNRFKISYDTRGLKNNSGAGRPKAKPKAKSVTTFRSQAGKGNSFLYPQAKKK